MIDINHWDTLFQCIEQHDLLGFQQQLTIGIEVNHLDLERETTPLINAIDRNWLEGVQVLIDAGADVNQTACCESAPILSAIKVGNIEILQILLGHGANPNVACLGQPLTAAMRADRFDMAGLLVEAGINVNTLSESGRTSLMVAATGKLAWVKYLISVGADANIMDHDGNSALMMAAYSGHQNIFDYLCALTDCEEQRQYSQSVLPTGLLYQERLRDTLTQTFVAAAAQGNNSDLVRMLAEGADINKLNAKGENALHVAAARGQLEVVNLLIQAGANLEVCSDSECSPLYLAVIGNHADIVQALIHAGATLKIYYLIQAACFNSIDSAQILVDAGLDVNARNDIGATALETARQGKRPEIVELLRRAGAVGRFDIEFKEIPF